MHALVALWTGCYARDAGYSDGPGICCRKPGRAGLIHPNLRVDDPRTRKKRRRASPRKFLLIRQNNLIPASVPLDLWREEQRVVFEVPNTIAFFNCDERDTLLPKRP
jgi:hypothetical protein